MNRLPEGDTAANLRADRRLFTTVVLFVGAIFSFGASAQSAWVFETERLSIAGHTLTEFTDILVRFSINMSAVAILVGLSLLWRMIERGLASVLVMCVAIATVAIGARSTLQFLAGVHASTLPYNLYRDAAVTFAVSLIVMALGLAFVGLSQRVRAAEREQQLSTTRATEALNALQQEELRVRRDVADALHGTMQQRMVLVEAGLNAVAERLRAPLDPEAALDLGKRIEAIRSDIDILRERTLRELSAALYPEALDRGIVPAVRALTARVPHSIAVRLDADDVPVPDSLDRTQRLLLVRIAEEGVSNALRHGSATEIELSLRLTDDEIELGVRNAGLAPEHDAEFSGLQRLRSRIGSVGGALELLAEPDGALLRATMPLAPGGAKGGQPTDQSRSTAELISSLAHRRETR